MALGKSVQSLPLWLLVGSAEVHCILNAFGKGFAYHRASQVVLVVKKPPDNTGDTRDVVLESGRSPGGGRGNPLQYSCLETPIDRGAWWATVYEVTKSQTGLK